MRVKEMIAKLKTANPEADVMFWFWDHKEYKGKVGYLSPVLTMEEKGATTDHYLMSVCGDQYMDETELNIKECLEVRAVLAGANILLIDNDGKVVNAFHVIKGYTNDIVKYINDNSYILKNKDSWAWSNRLNV
jgi:hypothetical protein